MATITQLSATYTPAFISTLMSKSVYNLTQQEIFHLQSMLYRQTGTSINSGVTTSVFNTFTTSTATTVVSATLAPSTETPTTQYDTGDVMAITVTFNDFVVVTGSPEIHVVIGSNTRQAVYASGSGTASLVFHYTIVSGDSAAAAAITVASSALVLNSGTIKDNWGVAATLTLPTVTGVATATANE